MRQKSWKNKLFPFKSRGCPYSRRCLNSKKNGILMLRPSHQSCILIDPNDNFICMSVLTVIVFRSTTGGWSCAHSCVSSPSTTAPTKLRVYLVQLLKLMKKTHSLHSAGFKNHTCDMKYVEWRCRSWVMFGCNLLLSARTAMWSARIYKIYEDSWWFSYDWHWNSQHQNAKMNNFDVAILTSELRRRLETSNVT